MGDFLGFCLRAFFSFIYFLELFPFLLFGFVLLFCLSIYLLVCLPVSTYISAILSLCCFFYYLTISHSVCLYVCLYVSVILYLRTTSPPPPPPPLSFSLPPPTCSLVQTSISIRITVINGEVWALT